MLSAGPRLGDALFPMIAVLFVALYLMALASGSDPELALARAGFAGIALAVLGRLAEWIISRDVQRGSRPAPEAAGRVDIVVGDDSTPVTTDHGIQNAPDLAKE